MFMLPHQYCIHRMNVYYLCNKCYPFVGFSLGSLSHPRSEARAIQNPIIYYFQIFYPAIYLLYLIMEDLKRKKIAYIFVVIVANDVGDYEWNKKIIFLLDLRTRL